MPSVASPLLDRVSGLRCLSCGTLIAPRPDAGCCVACTGPDPGILDVEYRPAAPAFASMTSLPDMFSCGAPLPVPPCPGLPATGGTPLVEAPALAARLGLHRLLLKLENAEPSGSLKDRATAIAVSMAVAAGERTLYCASAGNAAHSLAFYAARLGLEARLFVPRRLAAARLAALRSLGAMVTVCDGDYDHAYAEAERAAGDGWVRRSSAVNPYLVEGKKTVSWEIATQLGAAPDLVVAPVGDGCTLGAIGKGFRELRAIRQIAALPRLLGVQAEAVQPLVRRFRGAGGYDTPEQTLAGSIAVRRPRNAVRLLSEVRQSQGALVAVSDEEMVEARQRLLEDAGVDAELSSAAALAGLERTRGGWLEGRTVVLVVTAGAPSPAAPRAAA